MNAKHRIDLDILKGIAIIVIVLYHMGILQNGYLGVELFFVINGFLIVPSIIEDVNLGKFNYLEFLMKRTIRLLPLLLLLSTLSLLVGYYVMLPDDYENLSESVIATNLFSNNILASITTKNYWDVCNEFKPLMHTWYIGILFEFYLLFPLMVLCVNYLSKRLDFNFYKYIIITIISLSIVSLLLYLNPNASIGNKFYLLHYRFFELAFGGLSGVWISKYRNKKLYNNGILSGGTVILLICVFIGISSLPQYTLVMLCVVLSVLYCLSDNMNSRIVFWLGKMKILGILGMMSYSIFVWHQFMLAFYRYFISCDLTIGFNICFFILLFVISLLTYQFIEQKVKKSLCVIITLSVLFLCINGFAFYVYLHAGVVRDVPELDIKIGEEHRNMFAEYNDRLYSYDIDFPKDNKKINVLIVGNSFARDWGNILLESNYKDVLNISYKFSLSENDIERIKNSDYIFIHQNKNDVPYYVWENKKEGAEVWGIGIKNFGESNGIIYSHRKADNYFNQTIRIDRRYFEINNRMKAQWGNQYVDLLKLSLMKDSSVVVFSDEQKFISQDCRHLTQNGAKYYARIIDFYQIFK